MLIKETFLVDKTKLNQNTPASVWASLYPAPDFTPEEADLISGTAQFASCFDVILQ